MLAKGNKTHMHQGLVSKQRSGGREQKNLTLCLVALSDQQATNYVLYPNMVHQMSHAMHCSPPAVSNVAVYLEPLWTWHPKRIL